MKKILIVVAIVALGVAFFALDLHHVLTLEGLKSGKTQFEAWRTASPVLVSLAFFVIYVIVTALSQVQRKKCDA